MRIVGFSLFLLFYDSATILGHGLDRTASKSELGSGPGINKNGDSKDLGDYVYYGEKKTEFTKKLIRVAYWLMNHKFTEIDQRYVLRQEDNLQSYFAQSFPKPPLRQLVEPVSKGCRMGFTYCVEEIYEVYRQTPLGRIQDKDTSYVKQLKRRFEASSMKTKREIEYEPFKNKLEMFQYRSTASYYMCYYTLQRTPYLRILSQDADYNCDKIEIKITADAEYKYGPLLVDYRADNKKDFLCAYLSFCPDPCCGKVTGRL